MKQSNPNWAKDLKARLDELEDYQGKVGWFDNAKEEDGTPSATVAVVQEYGSPQKNIPPRLGMRETVSKKNREWKNIAALMGKRVLEGTATTAQLVETLVMAARRDFFKRINSNPKPPLAEVTLRARRRRGNMSETTMVDTARMIEGLETKVEKV